MQNTCPEEVKERVLKHAKEVWFRTKKFVFLKRANSHLNSEAMPRTQDLGPFVERGRKRDCMTCVGQRARYVNAAMQKVQKQSHQKKTGSGSGNSRRTPKLDKEWKKQQAVGAEMAPRNLAGMGEESEMIP